MTALTPYFTSDLSVELIQHQGTDKFVAQTARVSTANDLQNLPDLKTKGLIGYLMKKRHGSPFEHNIFTFRIEAPIFVAREAFRHRIASYNEVSGRYTQLEPKFYLYPEDRPLVQAGSSAHPDLQHTEDNLLYRDVLRSQQSAAEFTWDLYMYQIGRGAALEVARAVLPLEIYTSWYVSMNARALMNFLSLRVDAEGNTFETKPQWEIQKVAEQMDAYFKEAMPITWEAFEKNGRVSP
jgi:thymidylate synthase (FAD)